MSLASGRIPQRTLILPVYNAATFLAGTLRQVHAWLETRPEAWELIVVDDASADDTAALLDTFQAEHRGAAIQRVRFSENRGKGFAVRVGMALARGEYAVFTDCDLAYPLENVGRILAALDAGADAAIACRVLPASTYLISPKFFSYLYTRHLVGRAFNVLCRTLTVPRLLDTQAGLKAFRTEAVTPLIHRLVIDGFPFDVELLRGLLDRGARIVEVPVSFRYDSEPSTVRFALDALEMVRDLVRVRLRSLGGVYRSAKTPASAAGLIVHADDFGIAPGVDRVIEANLEAGTVTSTSLLLGTPHSAAALAWAADHPQYDYGVHLNLTHGRPLLPASQIPSLVTPGGEFPSLGRLLARHLLRRLRPEEVRAELSAQIAAARGAGVPLTHLNSHQHVHLLPRLFSKVIAPLAREERLALRTMDGPVRCHRWQLDVKGVLLRLATLACRRRDPGPPIAAARGTGTVLMRRPTLPVVRSLLSRMKPGQVYELVVHPGRVDEALRASGDGYLEGRESERRLLVSEEFRALIRHAGLQVRSFHEGPRPPRDL